MGKKEICGTEKQVCWDVIGGPKKPEEKPLSHRYKDRNSDSMAGKEHGQSQKYSSAVENAGNDNDRS